jgi:integrase
MQRYPHLMQQGHVWFVRMVVPPDVRGLIGKSIIKVATQERDIHRAATVAAPIIAGIKQAIETARAKLKPSIETRAEELAANFQAKHGDDAERFVLTDIFKYALIATGQSIPQFVKTLPQRGTVLLPDLSDPVAQQVALITNAKTPFMKHAEAWKKQVAVAAKTRDEYWAAIVDFAATVKKPLEDLKGHHVQGWIDAALNAGDDEGLDAQTVRKKLSGMRNYWNFLRFRGLVGDERKPFDDRDVKNPPNRVKIDVERYEPAQVVALWQAAEAKGNHPLADLIKIAAYTGGRREGISRLRVTDIKTDPDTKVRFMHMRGKTDAGDRDVPIHSAIEELIDRLMTSPDHDGYLIASRAENQYGLRATIIGKEFAALKTSLGYGEGHTFHSIRHTVSHLFEAAECPEGVAQDIIGHKKLSLTYGLYSGRTRLDQRARWLEKSIVYPTQNGQSSAMATS